MRVFRVAMYRNMIVIGIMFYGQEYLLNIYLKDDGCFLLSYLEEHFESEDRIVCDNITITDPVLKSLKKLTWGDIADDETNKKISDLLGNLIKSVV